MTRSFRHNKIFGNTTSKSEKDDKKIWHSRFRARVKTLLRSGEEADVHIREVSNPWDFNKDGKNYWNNATEKDMRK